MMDRHMLKKMQSYIHNIESLPALVPWFPKSRARSAS
jgi:hypothetical protein